MRTHARTTLLAAGVQTLPTSLAALFPILGVRKVRLAPMQLEGGLRAAPDGRYDIVVREDRAPTRRRFTIAHELGHLLFYQHAPVAKSEQKAQGRNAPLEEEQLCNVAAEELVMPEGHVQLLLAGADDPTAAVLELAATCDVSVEAAMFRIAGASGLRGQFELWRRDGRDWRLARAKRSGGFGTRLEGYVVEDYRHRYPESIFAATPFRRAGWLCSPSSRAAPSLRATTFARLLGRRVPTALVFHHANRPVVAPRDDIFAMARAQRAGTGMASCPECHGTGWIDPVSAPFSGEVRYSRACRCRAWRTHPPRCA
ncbi:MAG: ImmA/IrrE family metallo-endopeptidase [Polyangiaceae bacterium]|nr:ImmA/IrrE family metallo-endopeptidase [Polyangiaceae bacterium]